LHLFPYEIRLKINGLPVDMFVDSGAHESFISKRIWTMMGKPKLERCKNLYVGFLLEGSVMRFKGQFIADVQYGKNTFKLPLLVTRGSNSYSKSQTFFCNRHFLGRRWLCSINLDWNRYFNPESTYLREETEAQRKLTQELKSSCNSQSYRINVSMNSAPIQMEVNSWCMRSYISQDVWEKLGKPKLLSHIKFYK
ncbi:Uncharacterized protein APZ42_008548, partial [Daphnia magna]